MDEQLYQAALDFLNTRFPDQAWAGVAAMYTEDGDILLGTAPDFNNDAVSVCHETGPICETYKLNKKITASLCIMRDDKDRVHILTPCGVCQERLFNFGPDVSVAVPDPQNSTKWLVKRLSEVQPYYWRKIF